jgi:hypothetical protein
MDGALEQLLSENRRKRRRAVTIFAVAAGIVFVVLFVLLYFAQDREERACRARGGSYDCKTSTGIDIGVDGKPGTVMMTTCECSVAGK